MLQSPAKIAAPEEASIQHHHDAPPVDLPSGYVGPAWLPGTGRMIFWTGRVAIGLRHEPAPRVASAANGDWLQSLMLN